MMVPMLVKRLNAMPAISERFFSFVDDYAHRFV
jgi:hypothetical protein